MKKLSLYIFLVLMWWNVGFAEFYELNKCFIKGGFHEAPFKSWEEFNVDRIKSYFKPGDTKGLLNSKIIYEGPKYDDYIFSINIEQSTVTQLRIYNDEWINKLHEKNLDWCKKEPEECKRVFTMHKDKIKVRPEKYKYDIYNIVNFAGGIVEAKFIDKSEEFPDLTKTYSLNINLDNNEVNSRSDSPSTFLNFDKIFACNKGDSAPGKGDTSSGTAFFINNRGNLITNNHVVEGCELSKINYFNKEYETNLISTDKTLDLALLKVDLEPKDFISFSNKEPRKRQTIIIAGYPLGEYLSDDLKINEGKISSLKGFENNSNEITVDLAINPGNSGGPIVDENGQLVAVAVAGMSKEVTEGISFGIKSSAVT
ncbi:MAG: serine protease, partial [SAR202 cluster bacterium]|nr:serine protease [SAR202 cluster bacterium]